MMPFLSTIATWTPPVYYSLQAAASAGGSDLWEKLSTDRLPEIYENMRNDVVVYRCKYMAPFVRSDGTNFRPAVIKINKDLEEVSKEVTSYLCKHEFSHIYSNSYFIAPAVAATFSTVSAFALPYLQSYLPSWATPISYLTHIAVGFFAKELMMVSFEKRAADFALSYATPEELAEMERFISAQIELNKDMHGLFPSSFSADGNTDCLIYEDIRDPLTDRLKEITAECNRRGVPITRSQDDREQMEKMKDFVLKTYEDWLAYDVRERRNERLGIRL